MVRVVHILWCGMMLVCPACRHGRMFRSLFRMNVRCPACGMIFERDSGEVTGGVAINTLATATLAVVCAGVTFFYDVPLVLELLGLSAFTVLFPLLFYRHARGLWTSIIYLTGSMFED